MRAKGLHAWRAVFSLETPKRRGGVQISRCVSAKEMGRVASPEENQYSRSGRSYACLLESNGHWIDHGV